MPATFTGPLIVGDCAPGSCSALLVYLGGSASVVAGVGHDPTHAPSEQIRIAADDHIREVVADTDCFVPDTTVRIQLGDYTPPTVPVPAIDTGSPVATRSSPPGTGILHHEAQQGTVPARRGEGVTFPLGG